MFLNNNNLTGSIPQLPSSLTDLYVCGNPLDGYNVTSTQCECANGYAPQLEDGNCLKCPDSNKLIGILVAGVVAIPTVSLLIVIGPLLALSWKHQGRIDLPGVVVQVKDFAICAVFTWQAIIQVNKRATSAPPAVQSFYDLLSFLQFDFSGVANPLCYSLSPFSWVYVKLCGALLLVLVRVIIAITQRTGDCRGENTTPPQTPAHNSVTSGSSGGSMPPQRIARKRPWISHATVTLLLLVSPTVCNSVLATLNCRTQGMFTFDVTNSSFVRDRQPFLIANASIKCYSPEHFPVMVLACVTLVVVVVGWNLATFAILSCSRCKGTEAYSELQDAFLGDDYREGFFWFKHVRVLTVLVLSLLLVAVPPRTFITSVAGEVAVLLTVLAVAGINIGLLWRFRPHPRAVAWRTPIEVASFAVMAGCAIANFVCALYTHDDASASAANSASFVVFGLMAMLIVVFFVSFWKHAHFELQSPSPVMLRLFRARSKAKIGASEESVEMGVAVDVSPAALTDASSPFSHSSDESKACSPTPPSHGHGHGLHVRSQSLSGCGMASPASASVSVSVIALAEIAELGDVEGEGSEWEDCDGNAAAGENPEVDVTVYIV